MRFVPLLAVAALLLTGCAKSTKLTQAPPATLPEGWTLINSSADGVSVGAPPGWRQGVPKLFDTSSLLGNIEGDAGQNPNVQGFVDDLKKADEQDEAKKLEELRAKGILCHCVNGSRPVIGEQPTRFYVTVEQPGGILALDSAVTTEKKKFLGDVDGKEVQLANGKAWRLANTMKTRGGDDLTKIVYVLVHEDRKYTLRFTSTNDPVSIEQIEKQVAETLRIDPTKTPAFAKKED
ncbi:hypothetical protein EON79_14150 [bacterium]|nr:MAG: hypothetical protein EON79_14150 [bacterium]